MGPPKTIYLTFDDGPCAPFTAQILDILSEYGAKATFFVCGKNAQQYPDLIKRIILDGHHLGNHTYSHSRLLTFTGMLKKEILQTQAILQKLTAIIPTLFRAPWGVTVPWIRPFIAKQGLKIIHWDIHAYDWQQPSAPYISDRIINRARTDSIILLHDGHDTNPSAQRSQTVKALPAIIEALQKQGYVFKAL